MCVGCRNKTSALTHQNSTSYGILTDILSCKLFQRESINLDRQNLHPDFAHQLRFFTASHH